MSHQRRVRQSHWVWGQMHCRVGLLLSQLLALAFLSDAQSPHNLLAPGPQKDAVGTDQIRSPDTWAQFWPEWAV